MAAASLARRSHSVFKSPNKIRKMVREVAREAGELAQRSASRSADEVLEGPGIKMFRQPAGTGKYRWIIEREFKNAIGKHGETVLKIVVDYSGRVVTAYPTRALSSMGLGAAAIGMFDSKAARAGELIQDAVEADQRRREEEKNSWSSFFIDLITPIGFAPGVLSDGETLWLAQRDILQEAYTELVAEIEASEQRRLAPEEQDELFELLTTSVGSAMTAQGHDEDGEDE